MQGVHWAPVQSLVRELRSHMLWCGHKKKKKRERERERERERGRETGKGCEQNKNSGRIFQLDAAS